MYVLFDYVKGYKGSMRSSGESTRRGHPARMVMRDVWWDGGGGKMGCDRGSMNGEVVVVVGKEKQRNSAKRSPVNGGRALEKMSLKVLLVGQQRASKGSTGTGLARS